mgnify:CR=1 FL=1
MTQTILCKEGYLIPKTSKFESMINIIKKELTVEPYQLCSFVKNEEPVKFNVYQENDEYISIPKYYGLKKINKNVIDEFKGISVVSAQKEQKLYKMFGKTKAQIQLLKNEINDYKKEHNYKTLYKKEIKNLEGKLKKKKEELNKIIEKLNKLDEVNNDDKKDSKKKSSKKDVKKSSKKKSKK